MHAREKIAAEKFFRENPHKFAAKLFGKLKNSGKPSFSKEEAQQYFEKTYRDEQRNYVYSPPPELQRPDIPSWMFSLRCPTENELKKSVKRKRNGAAPGLNQLTYVPYKKCSGIMKFVLKLGQKNWKSKASLLIGQWLTSFFSPNLMIFHKYLNLGLLRLRPL